MAPIFIIGTERSGTNLLRLILNEHSSIAVPHPPHIMKLFGPLAPLYGDLREDGNFRLLVNDVCRMVELHPYPWGVRLDRGRIFREADGRDLLAVYFAAYDQYLAASGKKRWACKSTFMIEHVEELLRRKPEARFLYMARDGRDVAVSARTSIFNRYHPWYVAHRWRDEQRLGLSWRSRLSADQFLLVRYEDLIDDPRKIVKGICAFLGERFEENMLRYHVSPEARRSGSLSVSWENTSRPVMRHNAQKFRKRLSPGEILLFEAIAHEELRALGYEPVYSRQVLEHNRALADRPRLSYRIAEGLFKLRAELNHLFRDASSADRMKKSLYLRYLRIARGLHRSAGAPGRATAV